MLVNLNWFIICIKLIDKVFKVLEFKEVSVINPTEMNKSIPIY